jgi:hypothetical protein
MAWAGCRLAADSAARGMMWQALTWGHKAICRTMVDYVFPSREARRPSRTVPRVAAGALSPRVATGACRLPPTGRGGHQPARQPARARRTGADAVARARGGQHNHRPRAPRATEIAPPSPASRVATLHRRAMSLQVLSLPAYPRGDKAFVRSAARFVGGQGANAARAMALLGMQVSPPHAMGGRLCYAV